MHIIACFHVFWATARKIQPVWPVGESENKRYIGLIKVAQNQCISLICQKAPSGWICTKFGLRVFPRTRQFSQIMSQSVQGVRFLIKFAVSHRLVLPQPALANICSEPCSCMGLRWSDLRRAADVCGGRQLAIHAFLFIYWHNWRLFTQFYKFLTYIEEICV